MKRDWAAARRKVEAEGCCRRCGCGGKLEAAHSIPRSLGGGQGPDSIVPLCRGCHRAAHEAEIDWLAIMDLGEQVEAVIAAGSIEREAEYVEIAKARVEWWVEHQGREADEVLAASARSEREREVHVSAGQGSLLEDVA